MKLNAHIKSFLSKTSYKNLNTVEGSKGLCDSVSVHLSKYLRQQGIEADVIEGIGYMAELDKSAHEDWQVFKGKDRKFLAHVVVTVDNEVIDLTGAQFNEANGDRIIYSLDTFKKEWKTIKKPKALN